MFLHLTYANPAKGMHFLINVDCIARVKPAKEGTGSIIWLRDGDSANTLSIDVVEGFQDIYARLQRS